MVPAGVLLSYEVEVWLAGLPLSRSWWRREVLDVEGRVEEVEEGREEGSED